MLSALISQNKSITPQLRNSLGITFYLNWEMSTFGGPCFCLPSSRVLGQVQVRQVGSRSRAKKTRCQLKKQFHEENSQMSQLEIPSVLVFEISHLNFDLQCLWHIDFSFWVDCSSSEGFSSGLWNYSYRNESAFSFNVMTLIEHNGNAAWNCLNMLDSPRFCW